MQRKLGSNSDVKEREILNSLKIFLEIQIAKNTLKIRENHSKWNPLKEDL